MDDMTRSDFIKKCWRYYLILEKRFIDTTQYVELSSDNFETYSLEYVNLLQSIGSEVDVFMKVICKFDQSARKTITDYCKVIIPKYPNIKEQSVSVQLLNEAIKPFKNWNSKKAKKSLPWWEAYDTVKHGRIDNYRLANLENVLKALSALYLLEMYYLKDIAKADEMDIPERNSELFTLDNWETRYITSNGLCLEVTGSDTVSLAIKDKILDLDGGEV